ncbi:hypothetical protein ONZ45_g5969 [Pleurotus djamor]|nr:hypothetical protein ONZ45_g5969 [Pleurotus djamor]
MADAGFFKGTSTEQDRRFSDKELKLLKSMKFPPEFDKKVDMRKVNLEVIRPWAAKKVTELVGFEDEVVVEYAMGLLENEHQAFPDPKKMQINLTGFLTKDTPTFMLALWKLLLEAQSEVSGVPRTFLEEKKEEMRKAREGDMVIAEDGEEGDGEEEEDGEEAGLRITGMGEPETVVGAIAVVVQAGVAVVDFLLALLHVVDSHLRLVHPHRKDAIAHLRDGGPRLEISTARARPLLGGVHHPGTLVRVRRRDPLLQRNPEVVQPLQLLLATVALVIIIVVVLLRNTVYLPLVLPPDPGHHPGGPLLAAGAFLRIDEGVQVQDADGVDHLLRLVLGLETHPRDDEMDVDRSPLPVEGLKIKGQAEAERKRGNWDDDLDKPVSKQAQEELERRESELKEQALRNKVMRSRKVA